MLKMLLIVVFTCLPFVAKAQDACADKKGGWKTVCLRNQSQAMDEIATRTYWELQTKIKSLTGEAGTPEYVNQLRSLLKKNELDFINYAESYCNMDVVLSNVETELNKILSCSIRTTQLRVEELDRIIEAVAAKQEGR